jgi:hypothetical protein
MFAALGKFRLNVVSSEPLFTPQATPAPEHPLLPYLALLSAFTTSLTQVPRLACTGRLDWLNLTLRRPSSSFHISILIWVGYPFRPARFSSSISACLSFITRAHHVYFSIVKHYLSEYERHFISILLMRYQIH